MDSEPFIVWDLFTPANTRLLPKENDPVAVGGGETGESNVQLELSLSCEYMSINNLTDHKKDFEVGESNNSVNEYQRKESLSLEQTHVSNIPSNYTFISEEKSHETDKRNHSKEPKIGGGDLCLELGLGFTPTSTPSKRERTEESCFSRRVSSCRNDRNIIRVERPAEERSRVSLTTAQDDDPWRIKKKLFESDLGHLSRLLLASELVESYVFPFWNFDQKAQTKEAGLPVSVWDCDTNTEHNVVFKQWNNGAKVLKKNWTNDFVKRRKLKVGDEIGLYWDTCSSRFKFSVLRRA